MELSDLWTQRCRAGRQPRSLRALCHTLALLAPAHALLRLWLLRSLRSAPLLSDPYVAVSQVQFCGYQSRLLMDSVEELQKHVGPGPLIPSL